MKGGIAGHEYSRAECGNQSSSAIMQPVGLPHRELVTVSSGARLILSRAPHNCRCLLHSLSHQPLPGPSPTCCPQDRDAAASTEACGVRDCPNRKNGAAPGQQRSLVGVATGHEPEAVIFHALGTIEINVGNFLLQCGCHTLRLCCRLVEAGLVESVVMLFLWTIGDACTSVIRLR